MRRAISVLPPHAHRSATVVDTLLLDYEQRQRPQGEHRGLRGTPVAFALSQPVHLRTDDCLLLDDGSLIEVVARPEPLLEVRTGHLPDLARIAWMLGDRHVPVEITERRLRLRPGPAVEALLEEAGARFIRIEAPFEPEGGAYARVASAGTGA